MVIGNGFFSDTEAQALDEMRRRSGCRVERVPFQTIGNIAYYVSETGDLYGMQTIQGRRLTRTRKLQTNKGGKAARMSSAPHREVYFPLQVLTYCTYTLRRWQPDVELEFMNGNPYDVRPQNLRPRQQEQHPEWTERMESRKDIYRQKFSKVCYSTNYATGLSFDDCKDVVSIAFIYITTSGHNPSIRTDDDFIGLWIKVSRLRAIDLQHSRWRETRYEMDWLPHGNRTRCERSLFDIQPGARRQAYLHRYMEGQTPSEIARDMGCTASTVSCSVSRSIQFLQRYFKHDIETWNRQYKRA